MNGDKRRALAAARGKALESLVGERGVHRQAGESDETLRARALLVWDARPSVEDVERAAERGTLKAIAFLLRQFQEADSELPEEEIAARLALRFDARIEELECAE